MLAGLWGSGAARWAEAMWFEAKCCGGVRPRPEDGARGPAPGPETPRAETPRPEVARAEARPEAPRAEEPPVAATSRGSGASARARRGSSVQSVAAFAGRRRRSSVQSDADVAQPSHAGHIVEVPLSVATVEPHGLAGYSVGLRAAKRHGDADEDSESSSTSQSLVDAVERNARVMDALSHEADRRNRRPRGSVASTLQDEAASRRPRAGRQAPPPEDPSQAPGSPDDDPSPQSEEAMSPISNVDSTASTRIEADEKTRFDRLWDERRSRWKPTLDSERRHVPLSALSPQPGYLPRDQARQSQQIRSAVDAYRDAMQRKIRDLGGADAPEEVLPRTADPAEAVIAGVLRYHQQRQAVGADQGNDDVDANGSGVLDINTSIHILSSGSPLHHR